MFMQYVATPMCWGGGGGDNISNSHMTVLLYYSPLINQDTMHAPSYVHKLQFFKAHIYRIRALHVHPASICIELYVCSF